MPREDLIPPLSEKHISVLRRLYGDGVFPETHAAGLSDVPFLDLEAMVRAGRIEKKRRGRYSGYRVTETGINVLKPLESGAHQRE